jgi:hypothetical protein
MGVGNKIVVEISEAKGTTYFGDLGVGGRIILELKLRGEECSGVDWIWPIVASGRLF